MIGLKQDLPVVEELINTLDVEKQDLRSLRVYEIQHVGAEEVAMKLTELGIISGLPGKGETQQRTGQRGQARTGQISQPAAQGSPHSHGNYGDCRSSN